MKPTSERGPSVTIGPISAATSVSTDFPVLSWLTHEADAMNMSVPHGRSEGTDLPLGGKRAQRVRG